MMNYKELTVGAIAAHDYRTTDVFHRFRIDFCCHGGENFVEACNKAGADMEEVIKALEALNNDEESKGQSMDFRSWDTDLLIDYILKVHHRGIRREGPITQALLEKVVRAHADRHPELHEVHRLFIASLQDLSDHLVKEEEVLFPFLYELFEAKAQGGRPAPFHCGSVTYPINVMLTEHDGEGERYREIARLTNNYTAPEDACESYKLLLRRLAEFERNLHEHIHLENNILFHWAIANE